MTKTRIIVNNNGSLKVDGDFGRNTENALLAQKGVKQIKLNQL